MKRLGSLFIALMATLTALVFLTLLLVTDLTSAGYITSDQSGYPPLAVTLSPPANSHTAPPETNLGAVFGGEAYPSPNSPGVLPVYSDFQGLITGTYQVTTATVLFDPDDLFFPGEAVDATLVEGMTIDDSPTAGYVWQFRVGAAPGSGRFVEHPGTPAFGADNSNDLDLGDLDGDNDLDLIVVNGGSISDTIWLNDGQGNFTVHPITPEIGNTDSQDVKLADLDADGHLDALVAYHGGISSWFNDGGGALLPGDIYQDNTLSLGLAVGDLDADGDLDAVVAKAFNEPQKVWLNDGAGLFAVHPVSPTFGSNYSNDVGLGDLDGDGDLDAVVSNAEYTLNSGQTTWLNDGTGGFYAHPITPTFGAGNSRELVLGDLDSDGHLDVVIINYRQENTIWLNDGNGGFIYSANLPSPVPTNGDFGAGLGDLDGDGDLDVVVISSDILAGQGAYVYLNDCAAGFQLHPSLANFSQGNHKISLGDLDADGDLDAVMARSFDRPETTWLNQDPADLAVNKSANPTSLEPGQNVTYTLSYSNNGPKLAAGVILTDLVPSAISDLSYQASDPAIVQLPDPSYSWAIGDLAPGAGGLITVTGILSDGYAAGTGIENWATIYSDGFSYNDPAGNESMALVTVLNVPPTTEDDSYSLLEDQTKIVPSLGVLANDNDRNGDSLTAVKLGDPSHGSLTLNSDGSFIYTPTASYNGSDSFTYQAHDGLLASSPALVSLTIIGENDPPTITAIADQMAFGGLLHGPVPFMVNDEETSPGQLVITATSSNQAVVPDSNLILSGSGTNRTISIRPLVHSPGANAVITVAVSDGELSSKTMFTVTLKSKYVYLPLLQKGG